MSWKCFSKLLALFEENTCDISVDNLDKLLKKKQSSFQWFEMWQHSDDIIVVLCHDNGSRMKNIITSIQGYLLGFRHLIHEKLAIQYCSSLLLHDDIIKWKHFPCNWPFVRGIHLVPVNSPHKGQWRGALMFSLICVWINGWVNNHEAGDLRRHCGHYDVNVMWKWPVAEYARSHWLIQHCYIYLLTWYMGLAEISF